MIPEFGRKIVFETMTLDCRRRGVMEPLGLDEDGTLVLHRSLDDRKRKNISSSARKHHKYYQYYNGIRIEAAELSVHTDKEDWIRVIHGDKEIHRLLIFH